MKTIKVCEYSRSRSFHYDLILQDQASGERSQDQWSSGLIICIPTSYNQIMYVQQIWTHENTRCRMIKFKYLFSYQFDIFMKKNYATFLKKEEKYAMQQICAVGF